MVLGPRAAAWRALFGALLLLCPAPAAADRELSEVVSEGEAEPEPTLADQDPTSFSSAVPRRAGEGRKASELVVAAPGALVRDYGPNQPATVSLRGSNADQVTVLLDGLPLNPLGGGGADLSRLPSALVERLEVLRGAVGARWGAGAVGGVVALQTRRPAPGTRALFGELSYGSFGTAEGSLGFAAALSEKVSLLASGFASSSGGDFRYPYSDRPLLGGDADRRWLTRENNRARRGGGLTRLSFSGPAEGTVLVEVDGGVRGVPGAMQRPTPQARQEDLRGLGLGRVGFSAAGLRFEGRVGVRLGRLRAGTWDAPGAAQDESLLEAELSASRLWGRHALAAGLCGGREALSGEHHGTHARGRLGLFLSDEITLPWLSLVPALRYDRVGDQHGLSPRLGAAVPLPGGLLAIKANAGRSFRPPSFGELYLEQAGLAPNPALRPETGLSVDLGPELRLEWLTASLAGFWGLYDDLILYELFPPMRAKPFNFGRAEVWGGEAELGLRRGPFALAASYTLTFSANRMDDPRYLDQELPARPRHRLHARASVSAWRLEGHVEADLQSAQWLNRTNTDSLAGRARIDLGASLLVSREAGLSLHAEVRNLFQSWDQDFYGYPLPGRSVLLAVRFDSLTRSTP